MIVKFHLNTRNSINSIGQNVFQDFKYTTSSSDDDNNHDDDDNDDDDDTSLLKITRCDKM
jgi:hypothetical protein